MRIYLTTSLVCPIAIIMPGCSLTGVVTGTPSILVLSSGLESCNTKIPSTLFQRNISLCLWRERGYSIKDLHTHLHRCLLRGYLRICQNEIVGRCAAHGELFPLLVELEDVFGFQGVMVG